LVKSIVPLNESAEGVTVALLSERGYTIIVDRVAFRSRVLRRVRFTKKGKVLRPYAAMRLVIPKLDSPHNDILDALEGLDDGRLPAFKITAPPGGTSVIVVRLLSILAFGLFAFGVLNGIAQPMIIRSHSVFGPINPAAIEDMQQLQLMLSEHGFKVPKPSPLPRKANENLSPTEGAL
jgi:hypothetical protein